MDSLTDSALTKVYKKVKPFVWVLSITGSIKGRPVTQTHATGFSLSNDGLVMTCAHTFRNLSRYKIKARRLDTKGFSSDASVKFTRPSWDLALLKVEEVIDSAFGEFASDGSLFEGEHLLHIGHPMTFVGSFLIGRVSFQCVENVTLPTDRLTCGNYMTNAMTITPEYRVMGHVWNSEVFMEHEGESFAYEKNLHPSIPIIQCNGLTCREGCSGGPVFNTKGEITGMLISEAFGYQITIHVTLLREFLKVASENTEPPLQVEPATSSEGVSKKARRNC